MNTDFNILWLEDADDWYPAAESRVRDYIDGHNFIPNFVRLKSPVELEIDNLSVGDINYDLILVDFNLTNNTKGSDGIKTIRDANILSDVIFYTSDDISKLKDEMKSQILEGVYLTNRSEHVFFDKVEQIIDKTIKRSESVTSIRGMLVDAVSEFDVMLIETIEKYLSLCNEDESSTINNYTFEIVSQHLKSSCRTANDTEVNKFFFHAKNSFLIDSSKLSRIVNRLFKEKYPNCNEMEKFHENYEKNILKERNNLAHAKKEPESTGAFCFEDKQGNRIIYDSEKCSQLRAGINEYNTLLKKALTFIK